jgi:exodeoxyribonuclease V
MTLSPDQQQILNVLSKWLKDDNRSPHITIGGFAGTGKTTLISYLRNLLVDKNDKKKKVKVAFCSYTGRATQNMKSKLIEHNAFYKQDSHTTIHGLIYSPRVNSNDEIIGWDLKPTIDARLIIVDEASMIDERIWSDLLSYKIPIIAVGDHGQLPPINGSFNLMENPHLKLEKIHRQAQGNPIIDISILARNEGEIPAKSYGSGIIKYSNREGDSASISEELLKSYNTNTIVLCGYNTTRNKINNFIRNALGFETQEPQKGDRVICLRNNHEKGIYNGMLGTITSIKSKSIDWYQVEIDMDDTEKPYQGLIYKPQFGAPQSINFTKDRRLVGKGDLFDFGYALTVHKSQGSQAERVIMFEERFKKIDDQMWKKWLYTGVTRAKKELFLFG